MKTGIVWVFRSPQHPQKNCEVNQVYCCTDMAFKIIQYIPHINIKNPVDMNVEKGHISVFSSKYKI